MVFGQPLPQTKASGLRPELIETARLSVIGINDADITWAGMRPGSSNIEFEADVCLQTSQYADERSIGYGVCPLGGGNCCSRSPTNAAVGRSVPITLASAVLIVGSFVVTQPA